MTKPSPDPVVVSAGTTLTVHIPGTDRSYTLRAPTFGEVGAMQMRAVQDVRPGDAIYADALRQAITTRGGDQAEAALAAVDAHEDARDEAEALYGAIGVDRTAWDADTRREVQAAERKLRAATRARERVEWSLREDPELTRLRGLQMAALQRDQVETIVMCVAAVNGTLADLTADSVAALPAGDAATILDRAQALIRPTPSAEKN